MHSFLFLVQRRVRYGEVWESAVACLCLCAYMGYTATKLLCTLTIMPPPTKPLQAIPYVCNNDPLPEYLHQPLSTYLDYVSGNVKALEEQEKILKLNLEQVQGKLYKERAEYSELSRTTSAVRRVPPEVVTMILRFALTNLIPLDRSGRREFARLRSVCSLWRQTAFSTPDLWKGLAFSPSDPIDFGVVDGAALALDIGSWLSRAGFLHQTLVMVPWRQVFGFRDIAAYLDAIPGLSKLTMSRVKSLDDFYEVIATPRKENRLTHLTRVSRLQGKPAWQGPLG
jgi:F-box-like